MELVTLLAFVLDYQGLVRCSHPKALKKAHALLVRLAREIVQEVTEAALLVLLRILLIRQLFGNGHLLVHRKTIDARDGDPRLSRVQDSTVHDGLDPAVAQDLHVVSYVDVERVPGLLHHSPSVTTAVKDI